MRTFFLASTAVFLLSFGAGCSSSVVTGTGGSGSTGTQSTGSQSTGTQSTTNTGTSTGTGTSGACPATEPTGGSCAGLPDGLKCTYGSSVRPECRDEWTCLKGQWAAPGNVCITPPNCPGSQPTAGAMCSNNSDVCTYGNTICICSECAGGLCMAPPPKWSCSAPPAAPCPATVPNDGSPCTMNGLSCTYGNPCSQSGAQTQCTNGVWVWEGVACPG